MAGLRVNEVVIDSIPVIGDASIDPSKKTDVRTPDVRLVADGADCLPTNRGHALVVAALMRPAQLPRPDESGHYEREPAPSRYVLKRKWQMSPSCMT